MSNSQRKIPNGTLITLISGLQVQVVNQRNYQISVKSMHPAWNGRIFFISPSEINWNSVPPMEIEDEMERSRR